MSFGAIFSNKWTDKLIAAVLLRQPRINFQVDMTASHSVANPQVVEFNRVVKQEGTVFDTVNWRFIATENLDMQFEVALEFNTSSPLKDQAFDYFLLVNGVTPHKMGRWEAIAAPASVMQLMLSATKTLTLLEGDFVEIQVTHNLSNNPTIISSAGADRSYFNGRKV